MEEEKQKTIQWLFLGLVIATMVLIVAALIIQRDYNSLVGKYNELALNYSRCLIEDWSLIK